MDDRFGYNSGIYPQLPTAPYPKEESTQIGFAVPPYPQANAHPIPPNNGAPLKYPTSNYPPPNYPPSNYPPSNFPPSNYPPSNYGPHENPPQHYPPSISPPSNYTPQKYHPSQIPQPPFNHSPRYPHFNPSVPPSKGYYWVNSHAGYAAHPCAVRGGTDSDGSAIFVGRAYHDGDLIPAKVIPEKNVAYICYNSQEIPKTDFQVLCEQRFEWVPSSGGHIPPGAVNGGYTAGGETLYIGRVFHENSHTVGKVHPSHGSCYIPYDGQEVPYSNYEILVCRS